MRSKVKDGKGGAPSYEDVMRTCVEPFLYHTNASAAEGENERELILQRRLLFLRFIEGVCPPSGWDTVAGCANLFPRSVRTLAE